MALNDYHIAKNFQSVLIRQREELEIGSAIVFPPCEGLLNSWSTPTKRAGSKRTSPFSLVMQNQEATDSFVPALTTAFSGLFLIWGCTPMKLRDHPLLWRQLTNQWPPVWASLETEGGPVSGSEDGVLTEVREAISRSDGIVLIMHHNDNRYGSILIFSDLAFRRQIFQLLKDSVGLSIQQVGDIDLSCTL
jgi:hypothetical protein